ncbi:ACP phosphodiesterase [Labrys okinawensis]|uniref:acyl carrier protein phosphodiesterase n=1 Tax=Labrys okinawensis TaxID=346911 RepID=UPI0039BCB2D8
MAGMNYLAHLLLSPPDTAYQVGNLLPDLVHLPEQERFTGRYREGIEMHRRIDAFTDAHPVPRRSRERLWPTYRRFSGIIVDIVYDHCLIQRWDAYHADSVPNFLASVRNGLPALQGDLPEKTYKHIHSITQWAGDYATLDGVSAAMARVGSRLRRPADFSGLRGELERHREGFQEDFDDFFPELLAMTGNASIERRPCLTALAST